MSHQSEIHIGDRGTEYRLLLTDSDGYVDPSDATVKQIIFYVPAGEAIVKTADVLAHGSPATSWSLTYTIVEGDGLGSPAGEFHESSGRLKVQAYLEWADGSRFHSSIRQTDDAGTELRVHRNLREMTDDNEFES
jgi:hypothetical protein